MSSDISQTLHKLVMYIVGAISTYIMKDVVKGIISYRNRNRRPSRLEFQELTKALNQNTEEQGKQKFIVEKMGIDIRRMYLFMKAIAGDKWPDYRKIVEKKEEEDKKESQLT